MPVDPAQWSWTRVLVLGAVWAGVTAAVGIALAMRAMERAKETEAAGGEFITVLPYGTRHLAVLLALALAPPLLAALRRVLAG